MKYGGRNKDSIMEDKTTLKLDYEILFKDSPEYYAVKNARMK